MDIGFALHCGLMFTTLPLWVLVIVFLVTAGAVWGAGIYLSNATDVLSSRWGLGEALGGLILLAFVTNLPEIAITVSGALRHDLSIAVGNILGGIALQTVVLVVLDAFGVGKRAPLTYRAAPLTLVLEGALVVAILTVAVMGTQLPPSLIFARMTPEGLLITLLWIVGLWLIRKARTALPWQAGGPAPGGQEQPRGHAEQQKDDAAQAKHISTTRTLLVFGMGRSLR